MFPNYGIIVTFTATAAYLLISYQIRILTSLIHLNLTVTIQLTIEIISNGICALNFKHKYMIVGLLWFTSIITVYPWILPLVSPAIAISRLYQSLFSTIGGMRMYVLGIRT